MRRISRVFDTKSLCYVVSVIELMNQGEAQALEVDAMRGLWDSDDEAVEMMVMEG